jgi:hypothetical protein
LEERFKGYFHSFKNKSYNSKFAQHLLATGHEFGKMEDFMTVLYYDKKGRHLDTTEKFYIYRETVNNNQLNDKHTISYNKIFDTILRRKRWVWLVPYLYIYI